MGSNDHTKDSYSGSPASEYEKWKHIIDIEIEPKDLKTTEWNIYKVPCNLRKLNEEAYTPQLVSIGPIHHNLNPMQEQKLRYLVLFWSHVENKTEVMDEFKNFLEHKEKLIRKSYAENLCDNFNREKLVEMMLLDSVFIMELFLRIQNIEKYPDDIIVKQPWLNKSIQRDLLLLENQIPWFILEELYRTFVPNCRRKHATFIELARDYFYCYHTYEKCNQEKKSSTRSSSSGEKTGSSDSKGEPPKHFTDLIRSFYICKNLDDFKIGFPLKTATKLQEVGVTFEKVINRPLLDIKFQKYRIFSWFLCLGCIPNFKMVEARFEIPELRIDHRTACVLSNIMALEQFHYPDQPYVCSYVSLFDSLIHTKEDVSLLVEKGVIAHTLRSDTEVETLVHRLGRNVVTNKTCYQPIMNSLGKYYKRMWWNRTMVEMRLVYFRDLWRASSTIIGVFVFMFTVLNVYQTIRGFYVVKN